MGAGGDRHTGTEPTTARSALGLRAVLAVLALVAGSVGAVAFALAARRADGTATGEWVAAGICVLVALTAVVDLAVLRTRTRNRQRSGPS